MVMGMLLRLFQSLSGFLMSCNFPIADAEPAICVFQSLSGFLMSCNRTCRGGGGDMTGFNPYRVF